MTQDEMIELAIQVHASTRDAIRWAMVQEREACAKAVEAGVPFGFELQLQVATIEDCAKAIRARGQA